jgi:hypothetical protein
MHTAIRHICVGDVGSPGDVIGRRFTADVPAPAGSAEAGAAVSGAWAGAGVSALPACVALADSGVVCGVALGVSGDGAVAAAFGCRLVVPV